MSETTEGKATESETTEDASVQNTDSYSTQEGVEKYKGSCLSATFSYNDLLQYEDNCDSFQMTEHYES